MANTIEYAQVFQQALDEQMVAQATTGWMEANAGQVIYNGGKTVKIPKSSSDGLGNYDRNTGYPMGSASLTYETFTMTQDRGRKFTFDSMDVDETNFVLRASTQMADFQRVNVIPEIDAYRYSKIASMAIAASKASGGYTPAATDIYSKLRADIATVQDTIGTGYQLVISMPISILNVLESSTELTKQLNVAQFNVTQPNGGADISFEVKSVDGCPIIEVPSKLMKTAYTFNDGVTAGQTTGGATPAGTAKSINWIICAKQAPIAISKTNNIKIFDPSVVQGMDAWEIDYRKYHDLWITDNAMASVFVNVKEALA